MFSTATTDHPQIYRLDVQAYRKLVQVGAIAPEQRLELIEGTILEMSPIGTKHQACVAQLNQYFTTALGDRALVWPQNSIELNRRSQPQPDLALLQLRSDFYSDRYPRSEDILLVIEVADTTVQFDREVKVPLYGTAGIVEMWLVDLTRGWVEVYRDPSSQGYQTKQTRQAGEQVTPLTFPNCQLAVADFVKP